MHSLHSFLPKKKKKIDHSCFIFPPTTTASLWFPQIRLYLCSKLFPCISWHPFPEHHALMQPARAPGKFRGSHQTPVSLHAHPCARGMWQVPALCRKEAEEQQDSGQQLGDMPLKQGGNLLMGLAHRGEKRGKQAPDSQRNPCVRKSIPCFLCECCWG